MSTQLQWFQSFSRFLHHFVLGLKKKLFVSCNDLKKNRVGRSVEKLFLDYIFDQKCVLYACFTLIGS